MRKVFNFSIGDIAISLENLTKEKYIVNNPVKSFLSQKSSRIDISLCLCQKLPNSHLYRKAVFKAKDSWSLYKINTDKGHTKYFIKTTASDAVFSDDFRHASVRLKGRRLAGSIVNYPLDEIAIISSLSGGRGIMVHAAGIVRNNKAYLFAGASGAGKSTITSFFRKEKNTLILSDDRIIIRNKNRRLFAYGTPWHGEAKTYSPGHAPLGGIFFLAKSPENRIRVLSSREAACRLITAGFIPFWNRDSVAFSLCFCHKAGQRCPAFELGFFPDKNIIKFLENEVFLP
ncbi:MAG: hypothetical protein ABH872_06070 [Candidatus Omnitrophota bacterium]